MATDRNSALGFGKRFAPVLPFPDGTIDQGNRQSLVSAYSAILAGAVEFYHVNIVVGLSRSRVLARIAKPVQVVSIR